MGESDITITYAALGKNGRTGNCLFQVAGCVGIAQSLGADVVFPNWEFFKYFNGAFKIDNSIHDRITHIYHEPYFHYTPFDWSETLKVRDDSNEKVVDIRGYLQSQKYWHNREEVLKLFEFKDSFKRENNHVIADISSKIKEQTEEEPILISVHFRYGDYTNNSYYADLNSAEYYETAISYFLKQNRRCAFICFSDDKEKMNDRVTQLSKLFNMAAFVEITGGHEVRDLYLQSICSHNIVANSSFSYWAHLLNKNQDKVGVFPKKWFGENSVLNTNDLYPNKAIII